MGSRFVAPLTLKSDSFRYIYYIDKKRALNKPRWSLPAPHHPRPRWSSPADVGVDPPQLHQLSPADTRPSGKPAVGPRPSQISGERRAVMSGCRAADGIIGPE